mmetsp:Transcript_49525/g.137271  ORF Transcript_49525/g.137271 Transcript_49525/m.137271 type:complete len:96 (-) Transcript_49525:276-563(-)
MNYLGNRDESDSGRRFMGPPAPAAAISERVWMEFQATKQYQRLAHLVGRSRARQVFGEGNVFADAASRARFDALLNMLKSLGMQGRRVPVPQAAI